MAYGIFQKGCRATTTTAPKQLPPTNVGGIQPNSQSGNHPTSKPSWLSMVSVSKHIMDIAIYDENAVDVTREQIFIKKWMKAGEKLTSGSVLIVL